MADFRRVVTALAVVVLLMGFAQTVSAQTQPFTCAATAAVTPLLRSEGLTELTGDIVLDCTGVPTTAQAGNVVNIQVFLNAPVTSRILSGSISESTLLVDDLVDTSSTGTTRQGTVVGNSLSFVNVPIVPPTTTGFARRVIRITNIRINASAVPAGIAGVPGSVQALISITGPTTVPISNPQLTVGFVTQGLVFSLQQAGDFSAAVASGGLSLAQCISVGRGTARAILRFREGFPTAFKLRDDPAQLLGTVGTFYNTESGTIINQYTGTLGGSATVAGRADFATRLRAVFANVPAGVQVWVSLTNVIAVNTSLATNAVPRAVLISPEAAGLAGAFDIPSGATAGATDIAQLSVVGGVATAVWEVRASNPIATENLDFQVHLVTSAAPATNTPASGVQATVAGSFAPVSTAGTATAGPIPRFVDTGVPRNFVIFNICRTILLFPFVTNQAGFDTGLAISNTSQDPLGTTAQAGTCTWSFFGANAPSAITTASIAAGTTATALASSVAPNFQGYAIAVCNFQFAHGFAFVSDIGARNLAMGYLALVIPDRSREASPFSSAGAGSGEILGQ